MCSEGLFIRCIVRGDNDGKMFYLIKSLKQVSGLIYSPLRPDISVELGFRLGFQI